MNRSFHSFAASFAVIAVLSACSAGAGRKARAAGGTGAGASSIIVGAARGGAEAAAEGGLAPVRFDYDQARLDDGALAVLRANAAWLRSHPEAVVRVEGHADERGTVAYNLALGQRRAAALHDYYRASGVPEARVSTLSYGKEKPECTESSEDCWSRNRRAVTLVVGGSRS